MTIIGHGIDLVSIARIEAMLAEHSERFRERCFTETEQAYCDSSRAKAAERYAARFAAKEAAFKALGTGQRNGMAWTDIEIIRNALGRPELRTTGTTAATAANLGITTWHVSISHTDDHAIASVLACGD